MGKVISIFGAGPGLGISVARRFGSEGYAVALVARRAAPLEELRQALSEDGIEAAVFTADLTDGDAIRSVVADIRERFGGPDAVYYSPASTEAFLPASQMTAQMTRDRLALLFVGLVEVVCATLPGMRERGGGAILAGMGGSAAIGLPFMSGPAPAQAAARNYLQSLHGELAGEGIHVAMATISGVIRGSAYHRAVVAGEADADDTFEMPIVDPDEIADRLCEAVRSGKGVEFFYPPAEDGATSEWNT